MRPILLAALLLAGCASRPPAAAHHAFFDRLSALCGRAFAGRVETDEPAAAADAAFAGPLVMHVRSCTADRLRIPFHVGEDRSRTWVITRDASGLSLKHDHRHRDGSEDRLTQYGGTTLARGTVDRQEFPADAFSRQLFERERRPASTANVWALEIEPGRTFVYELARPGRRFRVRFDLEQAVAAPPAPWSR